MKVYLCVNIVYSIILINKPIPCTALAMTCILHVIYVCQSYSMILGNWVTDGGCAGLL